MQQYRNAVKDKLAAGQLALGLSIRLLRTPDAAKIAKVTDHDLRAQIGLPGQFDHPRVAQMYQQVIAACRRHGKYAGLGGVRDAALCERYLRLGFRFMTTNSDLAFLLAGASQRTTELRKLSSP